MEKTIDQIFKEIDVALNIDEIEIEQEDVKEKKISTVERNFDKIIEYFDKINNRYLPNERKAVEDIFEDYCESENYYLQKRQQRCDCGADLFVKSIIHNIDDYPRYTPDYPIQNFLDDTYYAIFRCPFCGNTFRLSFQNRNQRIFEIKGERR